MKTYFTYTTQLTVDESRLQLADTVSFKKFKTNALQCEMEQILMRLDHFSHLISAQQEYYFKRETRLQLNEPNLDQIPATRAFITYIQSIVPKLEQFYFWVNDQEPLISISKARVNIWTQIGNVYKIHGSQLSELEMRDCMLVSRAVVRDIGSPETNYQGTDTCLKW